MNLVTRLVDAAEDQPEVSALVDPNGSSLSFAQLDEATASGADFLRSLGLKKGDPVLLLHPIESKLYVVLLSVLRAGMVAVLTDPSASRQTVKRAVDLCPPSAFVGTRTAQLLRWKFPDWRRIPVRVSTTGWFPGTTKWNPKPANDRGVVAVDHDDLALVTFTSGSTGQPKAVGRSHRLLLAQHEALAEAIALQPGEVDLVTLPVFVLANLASGLTSILADTDLAKPRAADADRIGSQIKRENITRTAASPAFLEAIAGESELTGLRKIYTGGAPVFPPLLARLKMAAPNATVVGVYGSTEAEPIADLDAADLSENDLQSMRAGDGLLAGKVVPQINLAILPNRFGKPLPPTSVGDFKSSQLASGEVGEILVAGEHVLPGYLRGEGDEETKVWVGERVWHRTGDLGLLDDTGRLWLRGRCAARIEDQHGILDPFTIETALSFDPGIARSAVLAHEGLRILVIEATGSEPYLEEDRNGLIKRFQIDQILEVEAIPLDRRHNAKIDYPALQRLVERRTGH